MNKDLNNFFRRIKLKAHFTKQDADKEEDKDEITEEAYFKKKSNWTPTNVHHTIDTFILAVSNAINNSNTKPLPRDNLTKKQRKALKNLKNRTDIIITKADKGRALVIIDVDDYIKEAET